MANRRGKSGNRDRFDFSWALKSLRTTTTAMKLKNTCSLEGKLTNVDSVLKSRDITLLTKGPYSQNYGFSSSHIWLLKVGP